MPFELTAGLWALTALVPFIILYLRRPRPVDKVIPSLMFLLRENKVTQKYDFFRKLLNNLLFILQLLALTGLAFAVAGPIIMLPREVTAGHTVIVLDGSASMQTRADSGTVGSSIGSSTRFEKAIVEAKNRLSGKVSIILAENTPLIILERGSKGEASDILTKIRPRATSTNLGDSILAADDLLKAEQGRIVVISDFLATEGSDISIARRSASSQGNVVEFVDVGNEAGNRGIVDMQMTKRQAKVYVKNYNDKQETINLKLVKDGKEEASKEIRINPRSVEPLLFENLPLGVSKIQIEGSDDFLVDDSVELSLPLKAKINVLLVTDLKSSSLQAALEASDDVELETKIFPPDLSKLAEYDVVVLHQFQYIPGTFEDLEKFTQDGGYVIITIQDDLTGIKDQGLMPVTFEKLGGSTEACIDVFNQFTKQFEKEKCFTKANKYFKAIAKNGTIVIASAKDKSPLIAIKDKVIYYGIYDDYSDFKTLYSYPVFWNELMNFLVKTEDVNDFNFRTGSIIAVEKQEVKTPTGLLQSTGKLLLDEKGIYELNNKKIAVALLNEKESDVSTTEKVKEKLKEVEGKSEVRKQELNLSLYLTVFVAVMLLAELIFIKFRGDV